MITTIGWKHSFPGGDDLANIIMDISVKYNFFLYIHVGYLESLLLEANMP